MSYIGKNIRKIRTVKKLSQNAFAQLFNIGRGSVGAYEEGRAEPRIDTVIQIAKYFSLSLDQLLAKEITVNELTRFDLFRDKKQAPAAAPKILAEGVPYVNASFLQEYAKHHQEKDFLGKLPKIALPVHQSGEHMAFEVKGKEMEYAGKGLRQGDILLCQKISGAEQLKAEKIYVLVMDDSVLFRRFKQRASKLIFHANSPTVASLEVEADQLKEIWEAKGIYSTFLDSPVNIEERLKSLEEQVKVINQQLGI
jgi:transcriptional regulator with XRE-family HTH domain